MGVLSCHFCHFLFTGKQYILAYQRIKKELSVLETLQKKTIQCIFLEGKWFFKKVLKTFIFEKLCQCFD